MIRLRPSNERGHFNHSWLDTYHTFSFGNYFDPQHHQFRDLRVINQDRIAPGEGFGTHPHRDMEILTYVLEGALEHRDSLGNGDVLRPGDVQVMTAGSGITHSEFNASKTEPAHLLQIWLLPAAKGLTPQYAQRHYAAESLRDQLQLVASNASVNGELRVNQNVRVYAAKLSNGTLVEHALDEGRHGWVQVARGAVVVNGTAMQAGDGAAISEEPKVSIQAIEDAELLVFDLA